jgi:hypothetical protein
MKGLFRKTSLRQVILIEMLTEPVQGCAELVPNQEVALLAAPRELRSHVSGASVPLSAPLLSSQFTA